jgi:hypothetical protein
MSVTPALEQTQEKNGDVKSCIKDMKNCPRINTNYKKFV